MGKHESRLDLPLTALEYVQEHDGVKVGDIYKTNGMWTVVKEITGVAGVYRVTVVQLPQSRNGDPFLFPGLPTRYLKTHATRIDPEEKPQQGWFKRFFGFGTGF
jgi:hypothetical protein